MTRDELSINVADVRVFAEKIGGGPLSAPDEAVMPFLRAIHKYPDYEMWFCGRHFDNTTEFEIALRKELAP